MNDQKENETPSVRCPFCGSDAVTEISKAYQARDDDYCDKEAAVIGRLFEDCNRLSGEKGALRHDLKDLAKSLRDKADKNKSRIYIELAEQIEAIIKANL